MALVVDGNTYVDIAYFDAYLATRYNSSVIEALDDSVKEVILQSATRAEDLFCEWSGYKTDDDQLLAFPRNDEDTPENIKIGQCEIAINIYSSGSVVNTVEPNLEKMKVDVLEFIFGSISSTRTIYNSFVNQLLSPFCLYSGGPGSKSLTRV